MLDIIGRAIRSGIPVRGLALADLPEAGFREGAEAVAHPGQDPLRLDGASEEWADRLRAADANALMAGGTEVLFRLGAAGGLEPLDVIALLPAAEGETGPPLAPFLFDRGFVPLRGAGPGRLFVRSAILPDPADAGADEGARVAMTSLGSNGRFANQMFQYAFLRLYGLRAGAPIQVPAWDGEALFGLSDDRPDPNALPEIRFYDFDGDDRILWALDAPPAGVDFWGYFQEVPESWRQHRAFLRRLFRLRADLSSPLDRWTDRVTEGGRRPLLAVHVRRGDYVRLHREGLGWYRPIPEGWYVAWLRERLAALAGAGSPEPVVFVATDEPAGVLPAFAEFEPLTAADVSAAEASTGDADLPAHLIDFEILRRAGHLGIANSSFSRMASLLAPDGQRVAVPDIRTERLVPYDPWGERAFWERFDDGNPPDPAMGDSPGAVLRRGLRARRERGEGLAALHWEKVHAAALEQAVAEGKAWAGELQDRIGALTDSLAAQKIWSEELSTSLAAQKAWTEELNASFAAEVARAEELRTTLHDRERRIAELDGALERQAVEMVRQRDALGAELEAARFQAMLGTPKWLVRRALLKGAFLGLTAADRALGWAHAGLRLRLSYVAGLIYDRRYHELSVLLRSKFGAPATAVGETAVPDQNGIVAEPAAPPAPVPTAAPAAVPVAFMGGEAFEAEIHGWLNSGWYGNRGLEAGERFWMPPVAADRAGPDARYEEGTRRILDLFGEMPDDLCPNPDPYLRFGPLDRFHQRFAAAAPAAATPTTRPDAGFSIVTPFFRHLGFFEDCACSVAELIAHTEARAPGVAIEWVIANDDPDITDAALLERVPPPIRDRVTIVPTDKAGSISAGLNLAVGRSRLDWVLFLDCDDLIRREAVEVLRHYAARFPKCRYISSSMVDIAEDGRVIRFRRHDAPPQRMLEQGMLAGHLKAVRRDAFADHGPLDARFDGCQDFEFVLRIMLDEPILIVPEPLYFYRWHGGTQSLSRHVRQMETHRRIQRHVLRRLVQPAPAAQPRAVAGEPLRGMAVVRTRGTRLDLLRETVRSIAEQPLPMTPAVVVHGDEALAARVRAWCDEAAPGTLCLAASQPGRRRGYPANVGIEHALAHPDRFDYVMLVDDDDILYPLAAERMAGAMVHGGADVVYAVGNKRVPWQPAEDAYHPLPAAALLGGNFIPINTYAVRTAALAATGARFDETLEYLEDWDLLIQLLGGDARFHMLPETVSEFRMFGDGNTTVRRMPELFEAADRRLRARCAQTAARMGIDAFHRSVLDFDFAARPPLAPTEIGMMIDAQARFTKGRDTIAA
ncbi:glycosyl transferase family 2 [Azospirillum brasilense]|nr:glycosyl transferase family 2 [Azospirillum brasilense]